MMKKILTLLLFLSLLGVQSPTLHGDDSASTFLPESIVDNIVDKGVNKAVQSATVYFANDKNASSQICFDHNTTLEDIPFGVNKADKGKATSSLALSETVIRMDYTIQKLERTEHFVGPRVDTYFFLSVAKGETVTTTHSDKIEGKLILPSDIDKGLQALLTKKFQANHDGTLVNVWSGTHTYNGPEEQSSCNSRFHYHALDYDQFSIVVQKTAYINVYAKGHYLYQKIVTETVPEVLVKKPVFISYHSDVLIE